jgi:hypothetical protein
VDFMSSCVAILQLEADRLGEQRHQFPEVPGDDVLAAPNANPRAHRRELCEIAVAAKSKIVTGNLPRQRAQTLKCTSVLIEADQTVHLELRDGPGSPALPHIISMRVEPDRSLADTTHEQRLLPRAKATKPPATAVPSQIRTSAPGDRGIP